PLPDEEEISLPDAKSSAPSCRRPVRRDVAVSSKRMDAPHEYDLPHHARCADDLQRDCEPVDPCGGLGPEHDGRSAAGDGRPRLRGWLADLRLPRLCGLAGGGVCGLDALAQLRRRIVAQSFPDA